MTTFFSWEKLEQLAGGNPLLMLQFLERHVKGSIINPRHKIHGNSFLLNPVPLFNVTKQLDILYVIQYIKLAAKRDYALYKHYRAVSLPINYYPDLNLSSIKYNPILLIENQHIFFFYEDNYLKKVKNGIKF